MRSHWVAQLTAPGGGPGFDLDVFREADGEIVEAFLVTKDTRVPYPVIAGAGIVPDVPQEHFRTYGNVYRRIPLRDPRMVRFVISRAGSGYDVVPFDHVVEHYRDLAVDPPEGYDVTKSPDDVAVLDVLTQLMPTPPADSAGLELGCGVGRGCFAMRSHLSRVLGLDAGLGRIRRARNIAVTQEDFFLPGPRVDGKPTGEIKLNLESLCRADVDFVAGNAHRIPLGDDAVHAVVVRAGDSEGDWSDAAAVFAQARRVVRSGGVVIWHAALDDHAPNATVQAGSFRGAHVR